MLGECQFDGSNFPDHDGGCQVFWGYSKRSCLLRYPAKLLEKNSCKHDGKAYLARSDAFVVLSGAYGMSVGNHSTGPTWAHKKPVGAKFRWVFKLHSFTDDNGIIDIESWKWSNMVITKP
ncbi:hypothetical protein ACFX15_002744 [Malus domestica]